MNDETANGIVNLVRNNANTINMLGVTWYGGEPLLEVNRIENLTKAFKEICNKNNVKYQANIVTNGYLLDKKMILRLIDLDITSIQITLDGTKEYHDQTRYLIGKSQHLILSLKTYYLVMISEKKLMIFLKLLFV